MTVGIPEEGNPIIQDFMYVDVPRVRSLLGQLYQGTPEKVEEVSEKLRRWGLGATLGIAKGEAGKQSIERNQETRSYGELHFTMFEQAAEAAGFLHDISDVALVPPNWTNGTIQEVAPEGSIVRLTAASNIVDGHYFSEMVGHMLEANILGGRQKTAKSVYSMMKIMYPKGVVLRVMPCGASRPNHGFVGTLLERSEYIDTERSALYGRYGNEPREWVTVGIVARRGEREVSPAMPEMDAGGGKGFQREQLDALVQYFSKLMESHGANESPTYPGVAIVPLAVYRTIVGRRA
ncbi:DUF6414 family protein [Micromonospora matsumotoense]|uniref:DUF6414 family protein n=1 Tax=Micromonospora matsumotoense TaxID=121616 RepID=UPI003D8A4593